jgi:preprotein translocase subunit SecY
MTEREGIVRDIRGRLERRASPRLHMLALVSVTAAVGLLTSFLLLEAGVTPMVVRYPVAVLIAYLAFLCLVRVWLYVFRLTERRGGGSASRESFDLVELPVDVISPAGGWDLSLDADGVWLIVVAAIAAIAFSILAYIVYIAPALFAELLLDAGLAAGLYRRLASIERRSWLATALRRTAVPAAAIAVLLAIGGQIMQAVYPDAVSIGRVVDHVRASVAPRADYAAPPPVRPDSPATRATAQRWP